MADNFDEGKFLAGKPFDESDDEVRFVKRTPEDIAKYEAAVLRGHPRTSLVHDW